MIGKPPASPSRRRTRPNSTPTYSVGDGRSGYNAPAVVFDFSVLNAPRLAGWGS